MSEILTSIKRAEADLIITYHALGSSSGPSENKSNLRVQFVLNFLLRNNSNNLEEGSE